MGGHETNSSYQRFIHFRQFIFRLTGQLTQGIHFSPEMYAYVGVAFTEGLCGAYFGSIRFKSSVLKYLLAVVLIVAAYKLLFSIPE